MTRGRALTSAGSGQRAEDADVGSEHARVGSGHQRSCTLPMMYFFGTKPQWRLSELLFRWSPITK